MKQHSETHRRKRGQNIALLVVLFGMVALFYIITVVRMGGA